MSQSYVHASKKSRRYQTRDRRQKFNGTRLNSVEIFSIADAQVQKANCQLPNVVDEFL